MSDLFVSKREILKKNKILKEVNSVNKFKSSKTQIEEVKLRLSRFPKTRYYGSKRKLLHWIHDNVKDIQFSTVLDAFGGTASVSLLFKAMGKQVTYNDALSSNVISAKVLLAERYVLNSEKAIDFVDSIKPLNGFIAKTFSGMYYLDEENEWLDGAMKKINRLEKNEERNSFLYALFQACLKKRPFNIFHRANLCLRTNLNVKRSFGNLTTWNKPFDLFMKESLLEINKLVWKSGNKHKILSPKDATDLKSGYDLVYLDPPYVDLSERADDYLRRYHFLEGLCKYEKWSNFIDKNSSTYTFNTRPHVREWQKKSTFKKRLFDLIDTHKKSIVVLSYVANAYPSQKDLIDFFKSKFKQTTISSHLHKHALAQNERTELLIIGRP